MNIKHLVALVGMVCVSAGHAAEYYPDTAQPGAAMNWRVSGEVRDTNGDLVALSATIDTELMCNGGAFEDAAGEAVAVGTGGFVFEYDHSAETAAYTGTPALCRSGTIIVKGGGNVPIAIPFNVDYAFKYAGTVSAYDDTTPTGCSPTGASLALSTADQVGSQNVGEYDGMWVQPVFGTGGTQNGRWVSTEYTYNSDASSEILCVDVPFETALSTDTVVHIYTGYTRSNVTASTFATTFQQQALDTSVSGSVGDTLGDTRTDVAAILVDTGTTLQGEVDGIQADTEDLQTRVPAALVSGRMDSSVGAMANDVQTAASTAADYRTEIQDADVESINGVTITGDGSGTPFGVSWRKQQEDLLGGCLQRMSKRDIRKALRIAEKYGFSYDSCNGVKAIQASYQTRGTF